MRTYRFHLPSKALMIAAGIALDLLLIGIVVCIGWCMTQWLGMFINSWQVHLGIYRP